MSHFSQVQTQITNIEALKAAVKALGFELQENAVVRGYGSQTTTAQLVIKLPGKYDCGFNYNQATKSYTAVADFYDNHVEKHLGKDLSKLKQEYARQHIILTARKKGHLVLFKNQHTIKVRTQEGAILTFNIDEQGNYTTKVQNVTGKQCTQLTQDYESGQVKRALTSDYFNEKTKIKQKIIDGNQLCG